MKKITLLLFSATLVFTACNGGGEPKPVSKDSNQKNAADSVKYNPATPAAQNSDDPSRYSQ
jgi:hypothetical protein